MQSFKEYKQKNCKGLSDKEARKYYKMYIQGEQEIMNTCPSPIPPASGFKLVSCETTPTGLSTLMWQTTTVTCCNEEQEGTTPMNTEREYLNRRLREVKFHLRDGLTKQFHIYENTGPKTYKDLIDWVTNGKYTLDTKATARLDAALDDGDMLGYDPTYGIKWNGAGFTNDFDGFNVAEKALNKAYQSAQDVINTGNAETAGLKALQDFEGWTYTAPVAAA